MVSRIDDGQPAAVVGEDNAGQELCMLRPCLSEQVSIFLFLKKGQVAVGFIVRAEEACWSPWYYLSTMTDPAGS